MNLSNEYDRFPKKDIILGAIFPNPVASGVYTVDFGSSALITTNNRNHLDKVTEEITTVIVLDGGGFEPALATFTRSFNGVKSEALAEICERKKLSTIFIPESLTSMQWAKELKSSNKFEVSFISDDLLAPISILRRSQVLKSVLVQLIKLFFGQWIVFSAIFAIFGPSTWVLGSIGLILAFIINSITLPVLKNFARKLIGLLAALIMIAIYFTIYQFIGNQSIMDIYLLIGFCFELLWVGILLDGNYK